MHRHLLNLTLLSFVWLFAPAQDALQPKIYRYSTPTYVRNELITINHYRFEDRVMHMRAIDQYSSFESEKGDLISFESPEEMACSIIFRFTLLNELPKDDAAATKLYQDELSKVSKLRLKGHKKDSRLKPKTGDFPHSYIMTSEDMGSVKEICTFFIHPPYLYSVQISSLPQVTATHIAHCSQMLKSLTIEVKQPESNAQTTGEKENKQGVVSDATENAAGTSNGTPINEQNSETINKMIAEAFGSTNSSDGSISTGSSASAIKSEASSDKVSSEEGLR